MKKFFVPLLVAFWAVFVAIPLPAQDTEAGAAEIDYTLRKELSAEHSVEELQLLVTPLTLEQLRTEADRWQGLLQDQMSRIANLKVAALSAEGEEAARLHEAINDATHERNKLIGKATVIVDSMQLKGAAPEVLDPYRNYISGALASEIQATDAVTLFSQVLDWVASRDGGVNFLIKAAVIVVVVFLLVFIARLVQSLAARGIRRVSHLSKLMQDFLARAVFWLTFAVGLLVALSLAGFSIAPLFAVLGGASFILAFAMQETLSNLASGMMIMINKPFDVGDFVSTNSISGKVEAVSIVSTTIRTVDNQVVILPNSTVWSSIITNVTVSPTRRVDMVFGIGYGDDIEKAMDVLARTVAEHPLVLDEPEPNIQVHELADSSVNLICRPWAKTEDYWSVYWDLNRQVKAGFDAAGITIPFPQRDVHLLKED